MECWEPLGCIYETHPARRQVPRQSEHFCQFPNPILIHAALSWTHRPPEVIFEAACSEGDVRLGLVREVIAAIPKFKLSIGRGELRLTRDGAWVD